MKEKAINFFRVFTKPFRIIADIILFKVYFNLKNNYKILEPFSHQDVLIVGNGPSLKKTPLSKINMVSIGMNKINLLFDSTQWRPSIITCVNGLVIRQNLDFFNVTKIPLILPVKAFYLGVKPRPNIIFIFIKVSNRFSNDVKVLSEGCSVTFTALQIAAFLKPKSVNIVGVDHKFSYPTGSPYEIKKFKGEDNNHFHPDYFKNQLWGVPDLVHSEILFQKAKKYFDDQNIPTNDYTIDGKLNIFHKAPIKQILN
jgi:hypothetical protein